MENVGEERELVGFRAEGALGAVGRERQADRFGGFGTRADHKGVCGD